MVRGQRMTEVNNSWVLVTGASSGFGEEFARQYAAQGHSLVLVARRLDRLQKLAETLREQYHVNVVVEQVDLSQVAAIVQLHERLRERGITVDILINNAGHGLQGPFLDCQMDAALEMVQLDIASLTAVTHVFAQDMRKRRRGKILLIASLLAYYGVDNFAVYAASKAYVLRLGEALHRELQSKGLRMTVLCPGPVVTEFQERAGVTSEDLPKILLQSPEQVAEAGRPRLGTAAYSWRARMWDTIVGWATTHFL